MSHYQPLSPALAGKYWRRFTDFRHARSIMSVPLAAPEISQAAAHLPLIFIKEGGRFVLSALVGLLPGTNHSLGEQDQWLPGYTPAWLRTPPFRITVPPGGKPTQRVLSVDTQSPWYTPEGEEALLDEKQQMAPAVKEVFEFLARLEKHYAKTQQAVDALSEAGVLAAWKLPGIDGEPLPGVYRIDEAAFNRLDDAAFARLRKKGALAIAYTQMISTHQLPALKQRAERAAAPEAVDLDQLFNDDGDLGFEFD